jgi:beta-lactam-binding protein with PASTA domain
VIAFAVGLFGAIILSLRSSETTVPDVVGKDRNAAENLLSSAHLNFRVRATRPVSDAKPDTVLIQIPNAGVVVKVGQTVAVDISRAAREGEKSTSVSSEASEKQTENTNESANTNESTSSNENKPRRPRNANANANSNSNRSRPANSNRSGAANDNRSTNSAGGNTNRRPITNVNHPAAGSTNTNRRPRPSPTP